MTNQLLEIRGKFRRLAWSAKGEGQRFCIASIDTADRDPKCSFCKGEGNGPCSCTAVSVKGELDPNELIHDLDYRFWGKWAKQNEYGRQFEFKQHKRDEPHSRVAVVGYLRQFAVGIGPVYASQLWDAFGTEAVRVLRTDPTRAANAIGIQVAKAKSASDALNTDGQNEDLRLELVQLLDSRGFNKSLIDLVIKKWGLAAPARIRRDPFTLLVNRFPSCGFARCNRLYEDLGLPLDRLKRQLICIWRALKEDGDGHTWHPIEVASRAIAQGISGIGEEKINWQRAVKLGIRAKWLRVRKDDQGRWWIAEEKRAANEQIVADDMRRLMKPCSDCEGTGVQTLIQCDKCGDFAPANFCGYCECGNQLTGETAEDIDCDCVRWPNPDEIEGLTSHQREQLHIAFHGPVCILTGDPGTGKTTAVAMVLKHLVKSLGSFITVCTPTNLAAMRLRSVMAEQEVFGIHVGTFHRILGVQRNGHDGSGWNFFFNRTNNLPCKVLVIDEDSMRDIDISSSLLAALHDDCLVLCLGDPNQLPPVGHGAPLRDGIAAALPHGHFTEVIRNCGSITEFCKACREGRKPVPPKFIDFSRDWNWKHEECGSPSGQKAYLSALLRTLDQVEIDGKNVDPIRDSQVLVAVNEKGDLSRKELNTLVQSILNPFGQQVEGNKFRVGDKVICGDNCKLKLCKSSDESEFEPDDDDDPEEFVANGEIGFVRQVHKKFSIVELAEERIVRVPVTRGDNDSTGSFDLAYALTIHKSQGSQWPIVFCLSDRAANRLGSRELWNTGGSRPAKLLVTIGELSTIHRQCQRVALRDRKTFLKELILNKEAT